MASSSYRTPSGRLVSYEEAAKDWGRMGFDLDPNGSTTRRGAQAPAASSGGGGLNLGGTMSLSRLGGVGQPPAVGGGGGSIGATDSAVSQLTNIADPWASQRGQYQTQLSSLMKDPSSFLQSDLFKASTAAGLEGVNRSAAAGGMLKSGNRLQALMDYGQKNAPENFFRMSDLLSGLGGAKNQNPGGGLSAFANLQNANTSAFNADTSRRAQEAGVNQWNVGRQDQADQQKTQLDQLSQWQQQQQQQQRNQAAQDEFARQDRYWGYA